MGTVRLRGGRVTRGLAHSQDTKRRETDGPGRPEFTGGDGT